MPKEKITAADVPEVAEETKESVSEVASVAGPVQRAVAAWVDKYLRNNDFSRDTKAWNTLQGAIPKLAPMIEEEIR